MHHRSQDALASEDLASEDLARQFVSHLFNAPPESREWAVIDEALAADEPDNATLAGNGHDHRAWFFGFGGRYPRWLGDALGYRIVGDGLDAGAESVDTGRRGWPSAPSGKESAMMRQPGRQT